MDMWFHFLVGVLIQEGLTATPLKSTPAFWPLVLLLSFCSHFVVDWGSFLSFHPDETYRDRFPEDSFAKRKNQISGVIALTTIIYFTFATDVSYFWAMGFAWGVDLVDWVIVRGLIKLGKMDEKYNHSGILHPVANYLRRKLAWWLPNWREKKKAWIMDFFLAAPLVYGIFRLGVFS